MSSQERLTRTLLSCGVVAGPFFLLIFAIQGFARSEFQFSRTEPSMLSLGPWGWVQIVNFVIGGLLIVVGAVGVRRVLRTSKGRFWGSLLLGVFGVCQIGVGAFVTDPTRSPTGTTLHGTMHLVFGAAGFTALMAACFVFVRTFASWGKTPWAVFCAITGVLFLAAFFSAGNASQSAMNIQFFLNLVFVLAWVWVSSVSYQLMRNNLRSGNI
jgi:glucan phosphoethanolaminetransferase (alkaline phosphatase superfamily)